MKIRSYLLLLLLLLFSSISIKALYSDDYRYIEIRNNISPIYPGKSQQVYVFVKLKDKKDKPEVGAVVEFLTTSKDSAKIKFLKNPVKSDTNGKAGTVLWAEGEGSIEIIPHINGKPIPDKKLTLNVQEFKAYVKVLSVGNQSINKIPANKLVPIEIPFTTDDLENDIWVQLEFLDLTEGEKADLKSGKVKVKYYIEDRTKYVTPKFPERLSNGINFYRKGYWLYTSAKEHTYDGINPVKERLSIKKLEFEPEAIAKSKVRQGPVTLELRAEYWLPGDTKTHKTSTIIYQDPVSDIRQEYIDFENKYWIYNNGKKNFTADKFLNTKIEGNQIDESRYSTGMELTQHKHFHHNMQRLIDFADNGLPSNAYIESMWRCPMGNMNVGRDGGAFNSEHTNYNALDIQSDQYDPKSGFNFTYSKELARVAMEIWKTSSPNISRLKMRWKDTYVTTSNKIMSQYGRNMYWDEIHLELRD